ncbi:hypothetical protein BABINDRAFT_179460 [Babjeviella inositovora NRRL Y-12698]|uniref:Exportin-T n=1 Tax=Babjeviella inositovora NRRL Y-12698 TaxID=984486 RepID=A0A1E3QW75_9ASCO|nr:uncharacterized protein BABINDRAFT_179460 [Babjeviella inositovora NRRL Y-12698]ODQ81918.1 hypothetical protein BABINDRAFT_179460 [Babjeviella inositovora NRRL Y-12698]
MEQQIQQAVEIALSGTSDPALKNQAIDFINQIKNSPEGYAASINLLTDDRLAEQTKFFVLQVIEDHIPSLTNEEKFELNKALFEHLAHLLVTNKNDPVYMKNKLAAIFGTLFCSVYINIYPNFLKDLLGLTTTANPDLATDYYLRTLGSIHSEIADKFITRERAVMDRNNNLKDAIRLNDMTNLTESWKRILQQYGAASPSALTRDILNNTLRNIGNYINWIEISLVIQEDYVRLILQFLLKPEHQLDTCATLSEIISKKMKPQNKLELLGLLNLTALIASMDLVACDTEFVEHVARLVNAIGCELVLVLDDDASSPELKAQANQQLLQLWPVVLGLLSHEYDDVSQQVFPFVSSYLLALKRCKHLISHDLLSTLLSTIIMKMKYDEDEDGTDEEANEVFAEVRRNLKTFQDAIAVLSPELYVEAIAVVINESVFNDANAKDWRKIELGIFELANYSDSLRANLLSLPKQEIVASKPYAIFQEFLVKVINLDIHKLNHPLIQSIFFELIVRHYSFFNNLEMKAALTNRVLELFTSQLGLFSNDTKVQYRCWYLFFRFVKLTKPSLAQPVIEGLVQQLTGSLLVIRALVPYKPAEGELEHDDDIVDDNFDNQLHLFEAIGMLVSLMDNLNVPFKAKMVERVLSPLFSDVQRCIGQPSQLNLYQAHHLLMAVGTFARGFAWESNAKFDDALVAPFNDACQVVLVTLESFHKHEIIRDASRFAFARFIPIVKTGVQLHLAKLVALILLSDLRYSELSDFLSFVGQIVHTFNKHANIYQLLNDLCTPLINKVFAMVNSQNDATRPDIIRDKIVLKKAYLTFLACLTQNNVTSLLITETNKNTFPVILEGLLAYAYDVSEPQVSKMAIVELMNIVTVLGTGAICDKEDGFGSTLSVDGFGDYLMEKLVALAFELPFKNPDFNVADAQFRLLAQEISAMLKTYYGVRGEVLVGYLKGYFASMGIAEGVGAEFIQALTEGDVKQFKQYFVTFIRKMKQ